MCWWDSGILVFPELFQVLLSGKFQDKLAKELLKIVHYNLQTTIRLSLFSKDVKVNQSFTFQIATLNVSELCPYNSGQL